MSNNKQSSVDKEFVPYEEALALKELGFDEPCFAVYFNTTQQLYFDKYINEFTKDVRTLAPTFSQAFRWFREKYDIQYWLNDGGCLGKAFIKITGFKHDKFYFSSSEPMEYEEAELACLIKLIEILQVVNNEQ